MLTGVAVAGGFVLDAVFGDPAWLPHPVVWMGRCISALEKRLRAVLPKTPRGELLGGGIVAAVLPAAGNAGCNGNNLCAGRAAAPAGGAGCSDVLVRTGTCGAGACAGKPECL